ncbi:hypothetical protein [Rhizobium hidalgonense]|uniref:hypothetical protein n=1 Tax=Rhizobium hidalgonense TaxID=1538159 RepID=UPI0011061C14|nr:hypothetical protein [Rhizobium hidalgonense]QKK27021.1 hypothetical protein FFM81_027605 [Rhizobium hidalgonense]
MQSEIRLMTIQRASDLDEHALPIKLLADRAAGVSYSVTQWCRVFAFLITLAALSPIAAVAQTGNCRVTHIDYHERPALDAVEDLIGATYVLSSFRYVPISNAERQPGQSEAARIMPDIVAQNPDVIVVHGSTFTGSANLRLELGELIRGVYRAKGDIRGFLVYSSAPLDASKLSIDGPLRSKLKFMYAPILNRFRPPDPSAEALERKVRRLCKSAR